MQITAAVDMTAAALVAEVGAIDYLFASEPRAKTGRDTDVRRGLLAAWGGYGLTDANCFHDARAGDATGAPAVGVWSLTAQCKAHSGANRGRTDDGELASLEDISTAMDYIRNRKPRIVIVENVCTGWVALGITCLLGGIRGYTWKTTALDPLSDMGEPMSRERQFWVGVLDM